jgi:CubicO group peptidase (beta-lactamase class C family)
MTERLLHHLQGVLDKLRDADRLSGVVTVHQGGRLIFGRAYGLANRSDSIANSLETRFQVASGSKIFTSVAICQLVQRGILSFHTRLKDCLDVEFPHFDPRVELHHLLTHTSGIPDYFVEEEGQDYEALWRDIPMYRMARPGDFLAMFQGGSMRFEPGAKFSYSDAAFVLLGLIIEQHTQTEFGEHVTRGVLLPAGMNDSGYFRLDSLPPRTADAHIEDELGESWRTNIYAVPVIGGGDGGAFVTAPDMMRFWTSLRGYRLLDESMTETLLRAHIEVKRDPCPTHYGYGVWIMEDPRGSPVHYVEGWDPGVAFLSASYPGKETVVTIARNSNRSVWHVFNRIRPVLEAEI